MISSGLVIRALKRMFARYGIPEKVVSDNGTQYASAEFRNLAKVYGFDQILISSKHSQGNGKVEHAVGVCKSLMLKALPVGGDFYLPILDWRNTPQVDIGISPAQRMFGRRTRSTVLARGTVYEPLGVLDVREKISAAKDKQKQ